ncbi:MAG: phosphoribosylaminoimidazolecarboxamide formyltransferase [Treponema sp.]|nr:phosphoribosylaminoimidazolecarboxamide formyltransferase [Treponema sp.]
MACISYCPSKSIQCGFSKNHGRYVFKQTETKATFFYGDESDVQKAKKLDASLESENIQKNTNSIDSSNEGDCSELKLKYGCNPNQDLARIFINKKTLPISVLNGKAGYINLLDALNGWQLVRELDEMSGLPSATSFKHVSPAGSAIANELSSELKLSYFIDELELSPLATAFARARGSDRMSSFGDFIALSRICDVSTARLISKEVSDGIIAPDYEKEAFDILKSKKKGAYTIIKIDKDFVPEPIEVKTVFGITFEQQRNNCKITDDLLLNIVTKNKFLSNEDKRNLLIALITLKYTQSNSVCFAKDGQAIGIGAGQQSRIHCTRLAASKADVWFLRQAPHVQNLHFVDGLTRAERDNAIDVYINNSKDILEDGAWQKIFKTKPCIFSEEEKNEWLSKNTNVALASDAFFPFSDNIERAKKSGVTVIAEPGGSLRDKDVIEACDKYNIAMAFTGLRLFHH